MKLSLHWLHDFVDVLDIDPKALAERLTLSTAEIEGVEHQGDGLGGVVAARVIEVSPHPSAENLKLARVEAGGFRGEVVCGAPDVRPGLVGALATVGSVLPSGLRIEAQTIRGVSSRGMLCS